MPIKASPCFITPLLFQFHILDIDGSDSTANKDN